PAGRRALGGRRAGAPAPGGGLRAAGWDPADIVDRVQHRLVAGDRELEDRLPVAAAVGNDVVGLAVVGEHIDGELRLLEELRQILLDDVARLLQRQAGDVDTAIRAQADGP